MLAHTLGNPFNLSTILKFVKKYNLWLIEDSCDALGSEFNGQNVGTFGDFGTLKVFIQPTTLQWEKEERFLLIILN